MTTTTTARRPHYQKIPGMRAVYAEHDREAQIYERFIRNEIRDMIDRDAVYSKKFNDLTDIYTALTGVREALTRTGETVVYIPIPYYHILKRAVWFVLTGRDEDPEHFSRSENAEADSYFS